MELINYTTINGKEVYLRLESKNNGDFFKGRFPEYKFHIFLHNSDIIIGHINLRFGTDDKLINYLGHIGYGIDSEYRGNKFSLQACKLLKKVLIDYNIPSVIITSNPDNLSSIKICKELGSTFLGTVSTKEYSDIEIYKSRYEWNI